MKKTICFILVMLLLISLYGCKKTSQNISSDEVEILLEEIIVDQNGDEISKHQDITSSNQEESSIITGNSDSNTTDTSSGVATVEIDYNTVVEVDICGDIVRGYLDASNTEQQYFWLSTYGGQKYDYQHVELDWQIDLSTEYFVYFSENADFNNSTIITTNATKNLRTTTLVPGKTYYWKVMGNISDNALGGGKIKIKDSPVRWIYIDGISNFRDMGGWKTESGKKVKYAMLYRGAQFNSEKNGNVFNNITETGLDTFNKLGIKTEFDIRSDSNVHIKTEGTNLNYVYVANHTSYNSLFKANNKDTVVSNYKTMFEYLSDSNNYPIYTHCQGGADRTGTYAFLLNGLLGVSYEDLTRDFELTSFAGTNRWRGEGRGQTFAKDDTSYKLSNGQTIAWGDLYNDMINYGKDNGCDTLAQSIEHWFINYIGIPKSQIDAFKSIMLE